MPESPRRGGRGLRVVSEQARSPMVMPPPSGASRHPWAPAQPGEPTFFVTLALAHELIRAAEAGARAKREVMSLLLGDHFSWQAGQDYTVALEQATAPLEATAGHVRFDGRHFQELARVLDRQDFDYLFVGWFHSHLGVGCFLSATDIATQTRYFRLPHQYAFVVDPLRREAQAFQVQAGTERSVNFAIFDGDQGPGVAYRRPKEETFPIGKETSR